MSYDTYIEIDTGGTEPLSLDIGNMTSNVSGMWAKCLTAALDAVPDLANLKGADARRRIAEGVGLAYYREHLVEFESRLSLRDLAGQTGRDLLPLLTAAITWGWAHIDELREDNPPNGWGDADGAMTYLIDIKDACEAHPIGRLAVSS